MPELPSPILEYVVSLVRTDRFPAYLHIDEAGRLLDWGGSLDVYGLADLRVGQPVGEQAFFLEGLLPLASSDLVLRGGRMKTFGFTKPLNEVSSVPLASLVVLCRPRAEAGSQYQHRADKVAHGKKADRERKRMTFRRNETYDRRSYESSQVAD